MEGVQDGGGFFIREEGGEGEAGMIVDGDVEAFGARAWVGVSPVPCGADTGFCKASELLDVEMEEVAGGIAFVADGGRFGRFQGREAVEMMAAQDAGKSGLGDGEHHPDLGIGAARAAQGEDRGFELRGSLAGLTPWSAGTVVKPCLEACFFGACDPFADRLLADTKSGGGGTQL